MHCYPLAHLPGDLRYKFSLGWSGFRVETLEEGPGNSLSQDLAIFNLRPWNPALSKLFGGQLLSKRIGVGANTMKAISFLGVLKHHVIQCHWGCWLWESTSPGFNILQPVAKPMQSQIKIMFIQTSRVELC